MSTNIPLKETFLFLFFLFGPVSFAQEVGSTAADQRGNNSAEADLEIVADQESTRCFEYSGYVVSRITGNPIVDATVVMENGGNGLITTLRTDKRGYYSFTLPRNVKNKIVFYGEGYSKEARLVKTSENLKSRSINNRVYLTPFDSLVEKEGSVEKIKICPINFKFHKSNTSGRDEIALEKVLFTMLKFPEIRIKIECYSNTGGSEISNTVRSYFRAKAARRYLISQGIAPNRIESANGFGTESSENKCLDCEGQESVNNSLSTFIIVSN